MYMHCENAGGPFGSAKKVMKRLGKQSYSKMIRELGFLTRLFLCILNGQAMHSNIAGIIGYFFKRSPWYYVFISRGCPQGLSEAAKSSL